MADIQPEVFAAMASSAKRQFVGQGIPLNQSIAKIAADDKLSPTQIRMVVGLANRATELALAKEASIPAVAFEVADPDVIEKLVIEKQVSNVLGASSGGQTPVGFSAGPAGTVVALPKTASLPEDLGGRKEIEPPIEHKRHMAAVEAMSALEELDAAVVGLMKTASITGGELLAAASTLDGDGFPVCRMYVAQRYPDPAACADIMSHVGKELDRSQRVVGLFEQYKAASLDYMELASEREKTAFLGKAKELLGFVPGLIGKAFWLSTVHAGAKRGLSGVKTGMGKALAPGAMAPIAEQVAADATNLARG